MKMLYILEFLRKIRTEFAPSAPQSGANWGRLLLTLVALTMIYFGGLLAVLVFLAWPILVAVLARVTGQ